jgi:hypothetical protein
MSNERHNEILAEIDRLHRLIDPYATPPAPAPEASSASGSRVETEANTTVAKQKIVALFKKRR